jgi:hypothetical protein
MANTIDADLYPHLYAASYKVARNITGCIPAVNHNFADQDGGRTIDVSQMGEDKTYVKVPIAGAGTAADYTPAQSPAVGADSTDTEVSVQITKSRKVSFHQTVGERESLNAGGNDNAVILFRQKIADAMNQLVNEVETDIATDIKKYASRARGVAGTAPFASDLSALTAVKRELDDNGAPDDGMRSFVMNSAAYENFMNLAIVQQANVADSSAFLRQGVLLDHLNFAMRYSPKLATHTKGTATGFDANGGEPVGEETIAVNGSDSGTILAGDIVTWVGDTNKYAVISASASGAATGNIVIGEPGMKATLADTVEGTIGANYTPNYAIHKNSYVLAMRAPHIESNNLVFTTQVTDPVSGLTFTIVEAPGDGLTTWRVQLAWGFKGINQAFNVIYLG